MRRRGQSFRDLKDGMFDERHKAGAPERVAMSVSGNPMVRAEAAQSTIGPKNR